MSGALIIVAAVAIAILVIVIGGGALAAGMRGYTLGPGTIVRCRQGHLFTTIWVPGASLKAVRLGFMRFQRCPVGNHWTLVGPVKDADLTDEQRRSASEHRDVRIP